MRKTLSIILLGCMIIYTGGYQIMSSCYRVRVKSSIMAYLKQNPHNPYTQEMLFKVKNGHIQHHGFRWEERGKEFYYQGEMYDVVTMNYFSDSVIVQCFKDKKETALVRLEMNIRQTQDQHSHNSKALFHKMQLTVYEMPHQQLPNISFLEIKASLSAISHHTKDLALDIVSPPPDGCLS